MDAAVLPAKPSRTRALVLAALLAFIAWTFYGAFTYSGPYRWCAELQMWLLGWYSAPLAVILPIVALIKATSMLASLVARLSGQALLPPPVRAPTDDPATQVNVARVAGMTTWLLPGLFGFGLVAFSAHTHLTADTGRALERVRVADLEHGKPARGRWLELDGMLLQNALLNFDGGFGQDAYVPVVSSAWRPGQPIAALLRIDVHEPVASTGPFRGMLFEGFLPGPVRAAYEEGGLRVADALILDAGTDPAKRLQTGRWAFFIGLPFILLALYRWRSWRRST